MHANISITYCCATCRSDWFYRPFCFWSKLVLIVRFMISTCMQVEALVVGIAGPCIQENLLISISIGIARLNGLAISRYCNCWRCTYIQRFLPRRLQMAVSLRPNRFRLPSVCLFMFVFSERPVLDVLRLKFGELCSPSAHRIARLD